MLNFGPNLRMKEPERNDRDRKYDNEIISKLENPQAVLSPEARDRLEVQKNVAAQLLALAKTDDVY